MSTAAIDRNSKSTMTARLNTDGITITRVTSDPSNGALKIQANTAGSVAPSSRSALDANERPTLLAVSENDPTVLVALQCDSTGALLIKEV